MKGGSMSNACQTDPCSAPVGVGIPSTYAHQPAKDFTRKAIYRAFVLFQVTEHDRL